MARKIHFCKMTDVDGEWYEVSVKGIYFNGEYIVEVAIKDSAKN